MQAKEGDASSALELSAEALVMAQLQAGSGNDNVLQLIGVVSRSEPFYLVVTHCEFGNLKEHLIKEAGGGNPVPLETKLSNVSGTRRARTVQSAYGAIKEAKTAAFSDTRTPLLFSDEARDPLQPALTVHRS